jgi:threonine/homoserine/homoserine lactone efflux protein
VHALLSFAVVAGWLTLVPGLDTALVLRAAVSRGHRYAYATVVGIGTLVWGAAAAGVSRCYRPRRSWCTRCYESRAQSAVVHNVEDMLWFTAIITAAGLARTWLSRDSVRRDGHRYRNDSGWVRPEVGYQSPVTART